MATNASRQALALVCLLLLIGLLAAACRSADPSPALQSAGPQYTVDEDGERVAQVEAAGDRTCVLTIDGGIYCWGGQGWGTRFIRAIREVRKSSAHTWSPERIVVDIGLGRNSGCAVDERGRMRCWYPKDGKIRAGFVELPSPVTEVAVGAEVWCLVYEGGESGCVLGEYGIDRSDFGRYEPVRSSHASYTALSAGDFHVCGLTDEGIVYCWGHNGAGQTDAPTGEFKSVDSGKWHNCAIDLAGALACWGDNAYGQAATPDGTFEAVAPGGRHTCAITTADELQCWGDNSWKQSEPPPGEWIAVSSGDNHSCAISAERALACWGSNEHGQTEIPGGKWIQVDVGVIEDWGVEFCALREDGLVACANNLHTLTLHGRNPSPVPNAPAGRWTALDLGSNQRCLQDQHQQVQCWRWKEKRGLVTEYLAPIPQNAAGYPKFSAGGIYVCLIDERQILRCVRSSGSWNNDLRKELNPQPVTIWPGRFTDLAVGYRHVCAVGVGGDVECTQLDKVIDQSLLPDLPPVPDLSEPVAALYLDANQSWECASDQDPECADPPGCLLTKAGRVLCWGRGSGDRWDTSPEETYTAVSAGCAIDHVGRIDCWDSTAGLVHDAKGPFTSLGSSGDSHCATTTSGDIHCWGSIGYLIAGGDLKLGAFDIPGVKIAAFRPAPDIVAPVLQERDERQ